MVIKLYDNNLFLKLELENNLDRLMYIILSFKKKIRQLRNCIIGITQMANKAPMIPFVMVKHTITIVLTIIANKFNLEYNLQFDRLFIKDPKMAFIPTKGIKKERILNTYP